jgi:hypothetical protein
MKLRTTLSLVAAAVGIAGYAVARDLAERTAGAGAMSGAMTSDGMTAGGMMSDGRAGMMDSCRDMMQGGGMASGAPNAQWQGGGSLKAPPPSVEKRR